MTMIVEITTHIEPQRQSKTHLNSLPISVKKSEVVMANLQTTSRGGGPGGLRGKQT